MALGLVLVSAGDSEGGDRAVVPPTPSPAPRTKTDASQTSSQNGPPGLRVAHSCDDEGWHHFLPEGFLSVKWSGSLSINCPKSVYLREI